MPVDAVIKTHDKLVESVIELIAEDHPAFNPFLESINNKKYSQALRRLLTTSNPKNESKSFNVEVKLYLIVKAMFEYKLHSNESVVIDIHESIDKAPSALDRAKAAHHFGLMSEYLLFKSAQVFVAKGLPLMKEETLIYSIKDKLLEIEAKFVESGKALPKMPKKIEEKTSSDFEKNLRDALKAQEIQADATINRPEAILRQDSDSLYKIGLDNFKRAVWSSTLINLPIFPESVQTLFLFGIAIYSKESKPVTRAVTTLVLAVAYQYAQNELIDQSDAELHFTNIAAVFAAMSLYDARHYMRQTNAAHFAGSLWQRAQEKIANLVEEVVLGKSFKLEL